MYRSIEKIIRIRSFCAILILLIVLTACDGDVSSTQENMATDAPAESIDVTPTREILPGVVPAPRYSTLTPSGNSVALPGATSVMMAEVTIDEYMFQTTLNQKISSIDAIQTALIDFAGGDASGISVELSIRLGDEVLSGSAFVFFQVDNGYAAIQVTEMTVASGEVTQDYADVVFDELIPVIVETLDLLLTRQLGDTHDLEEMIFNETTIDVTLLVPGN